MLSLTNPATEEIFQSLATTSASELRQAYDTAVQAQKLWAATPYLERAQVIGKFHSLLAAAKEECARLVSQEMGKPVHQAEGEIAATLGRIAWFLDNTPQAIGREVARVSPPMIEEISYEPLGVIANISAWNFPYFVGTNVIIPALLTGNAVLYKPSELTSLTGLKIGALLHEAGLPAGVCQVLIGGPGVGEALCQLPIDGMFFTGSLATGKKIAAATAAATATGFPRLGLELGGKDPAYVCQDVDPQEAAAAVADGAFYNAGQSCCAVERIYVHRDIYDDFIRHFADFTSRLVVGSPENSASYMGPLARKEQPDFLAAQVADALSKGARYLVEGGKSAGRGYYFAPTALINTNHSMRLMREESFGPVIGIQRVEDDREALTLMNASDYGLTASVHTLNKERALALMQGLAAGTVYWNCCDRVSPYLPWTGRKGSGIGSTLSSLGIKAFLQPKAWHLKHPSL